VVWRATTGTWYWVTYYTGYSFAQGGSKQFGSAALGDIPIVK
jgi:hypothetical protein